MLRLCGLAALWCCISSVHAAGVPDDCTQLIVGLAPDWNAIHGRALLLQRTRGGSWNPVGPSFPVLFGKNGLAWGSGVAGQNEKGLRKKERDGRAPAGIFHLGKIYTYDAQLPPGADYPFHQVGEGDIWSDDPRSPNYNRHVVIDPQHPPDNYSHERMRPGDFAYHWVIDIRHNADPPIPGNGSAIFFHIRRGVNRPTAGCTTMAESDLVRMIKWLRAPADPCFVLLPEEAYRKKWQEWQLPAPELLGLKR